MIFNEFLSSYNISLNDQQKEAVSTLDGPCLLLAVPGSGKTAVLVTRLGYMIYGCDISPEDILTLTYTKEIANDMKERYISLFGNDEEKTPLFGTINELCAKILMYFGKKVGRALFKLEEEGARTKRIYEIFNKCTDTHATESEIQEISRMITYVKNMDLSDKEIEKIDKECDYPFKKLYDAYNEKMIREKVIDYDDQMTYAYRILQTDKETLEHFQKQYKYICVDDAQDASKIQHMIISLLSGKTGNLFMAGDEDQSIYSFKASYPEALLEFEKEHTGAKVLLMEENYRSNANVVFAADLLIKNNTLRHQKTMRPHREAGSEIEKITITRRQDQYEHIIKAAGEDKEMAVLYKDNESIIPLVDLFDRKGIPFKMCDASIAFFNSKAVVEIVSVMKRILDVDDKDMNKLCNLSPETLLSHIISKKGYGTGVLKSDSKIEILKAIFKNTKTIEEAIDRIEELKNIISSDEVPEDCKVTFSTIYGSKGLEFETVYILDAIDGIFPDKVYYSTGDLSKEKVAEYEENRRLFYVGITRAKDNLVLFKLNGKSKFVDEVRAVKKINQSLGDALAKKYLIAAKASTMTSEQLVDKLVEGRMVMHKKFGKGEVLGVKMPFVDIQFANTRKSLNVDIMAKNGLLKPL